MNNISTLVNIFENIEKIRTTMQRRKTFLAKTVICPLCQRTFVPNSSVKSCPRCAKCHKHLGIGKKSIPDTCPCGGSRCKSMLYTAFPCRDDFLEKYIPIIKSVENEVEKDINKIVTDHPLWYNFGRYVKGVGKISLARIIGHTDIALVPTATSMWAHAGWGLKPNADGKFVPQRKRAGQTIDYDQRLQSALCVIGQCLIYAQGKFYDYYVRQKEKFLAQGLIKGHAHNRAFRHMIKLFLALLWEVWRTSEALPAPEPYPIAFLGHADRIRPQDLFDYDPLTLDTPKRLKRTRKE